MPAISENLKKAAEVLSSAEITDPPREAGSLLVLATGKDRTFLIAHPEYELTESEQKLFDDYLRRRATHEPFQYIAGRQEFYGLDFIVTPDVLIPRPETEMIVETAIGLFKNTDELFFCEIGVGSGCISAAILHEIKNARAIGFDISEKALYVAEKNAVKNNVADRLELGVSDVFSGVDASLYTSLQFDLIVSNPPYISVSDFAVLQPEVRGHEPAAALTDNGDGLSIIKKIINEAANFLKPGGYLLMEIGIGQSKQVGEMILPGIWQVFEILPDLQGIPRMVKLRRAL
jgi:release factor glutamine methyltransferase